MDQFILNIIPRIIEHGRKLNKIESIVDKVWVKYGEAEYETYRFKRNNQVLVSVGGIVEERSWELLPPNGLYISKNGTGFMLRQAVVFDAILIMQLESKVFRPVLFYDESIIEDGNVYGYLMSIEENKKPAPPKERNLPEFKIRNFQLAHEILTIKVGYLEPSIIGAEAFINNTKAQNKKYFPINDDIYKWIKVLNGKVVDFQQH
jgi:hypothetical protein